MLLDSRGRARLEAKRHNRAVTAALCLYVGETPAAKGVGAWYVGGRNPDIETIAAPVSLIVIQRLVRTQRYA